MRHRLRLGAAAPFALAFVLAALAGGTTADAQPAAGTSPKLRSDLAALVQGRSTLDSRIAALVAGYQPGELPYFAVLTEPNDAVHQAQLMALGARVLRRYRSIDAFALASTPAVVDRVAELAWVRWLAPVELVHGLSHEPYVDQTRGVPADVGATPSWEAGVTGKGVRIAVLDTGLTTHPDLDDLDFRHWSSPLNPAKVVDSRDFNGGLCKPLLGDADGHGHGTHVAGIAAGTGEGGPLPDDDGKYAGVAPDAELAAGKVLTDTGVGLNSDLVFAMEWAAMPTGSTADGCTIGADIVNMSLGSESRPVRLNTGDDIDFVSVALNRLAARYGTLFSVATGNQQGYTGSSLEAPGTAAQAMVVGAANKDYDNRFDDTQSGDPCAGWLHDPPPFNRVDPIAIPCGTTANAHPPSLAAVSARGPTGDLWLRPDVVAPGYNIVSAQAATGTALAGNDWNPGTFSDPLYATATGTSMATPAASGSAALLLQAYRDANSGADPTGASGVAGRVAPPYVLLRAALMNTALPDLFEARWIIPPAPGGLVELIGVEVRSRAADPYVGPLGEGAGKIDVRRATAALRNGVVVYSAATGPDPANDADTGPRDFQGSWQIGAASAGATVSQRFVVHAAPGAPALSATWSYEAGHPSDSSRALPSSWVGLPDATALGPGGGDAVVTVQASIPANAEPGYYTGRLVVQVSNGQTLRLPVFAAVALHDASPKAGELVSLASDPDVFARGDTTWPSVVGAAGGALSDWVVYPVDVAAGFSELRLTARDATSAGDDVYDLYVYDRSPSYRLVASTHPFAAEGVTDSNANGARCPQAPCASATLTLLPSALGPPGRYYVAVNRAKSGGTKTGDFGAYVFTVDEVHPPADVSLTSVDSPDPVQAGKELTYTLTARNSGPGQATDVSVTHALPAGAAFVSASPSQGTCAGTGPVSCSLGTLASGATATVVVKVRPTVAGTATSTASVAASETDPNAANNSATATTTVTAAADLAVTSTDVPDPVKVGQALTYSVHVVNNGPSPATGIKLDVLLPKNAGFGSASPSQGSCSVKPSKQQVTCALGSLGSGSSATVTVTIKPTAKGTLTSTATVAAASPVDPDAANNTAKATTTVVP